MDRRIGGLEGVAEDGRWEGRECPLAPAVRRIRMARKPWPINEIPPIRACLCLLSPPKSILMTLCLTMGIIAGSLGPKQ